MKKIILLLITIFLLYVIYSLFNIRKINYVSITDNILNDYNNEVNEYLLESNKLGNFNNYFTSSSIINLYRDIRNNKTIEIDIDYYLKKVLRESDILVISVGMEEITNNFDKYNMLTNYKYFNKMYEDIVRVVKEIKKYAYGKIIFIGYYNPTNYYDSNSDRFFYDMNIKLERLMIDNDIIYIDLYELKKENKDFNKKIAKAIMFYIE